MNNAPKKAQKQRVPRPAKHEQKGRDITDASRSIVNALPCSVSVTNMQRISPGGHENMSLPSSSSDVGGIHKKLPYSTSSAIDSHIVHFGSFSKDATFPSHLQNFQPPLQMGYATKKGRPAKQVSEPKKKQTNKK